MGNHSSFFLGNIFFVVFLFSCKTTSDAEKNVSTTKDLSSLLPSASVCSKPVPTLQSENAGSLSILNDGNLIHYTPLSGSLAQVHWASNSNTLARNEEATFSCEELQVSNALLSPNGRFKAVIEDTGTIVVYQAKIGKIWESHGSEGVGVGIKYEKCDESGKVCSPNKEFFLTLYSNGQQKMIHLRKYSTTSEAWLTYWQSLRCLDNIQSGSTDCR